MRLCPVSIARPAGGTAGLLVPLRLRLWCGGRAAVRTGVCFAGRKVPWFVKPSCSPLAAGSTQAWRECAQGHPPQPQVLVGFPLLLLPVKTARARGPQVYPKGPPHVCQVGR